MQPGAVNWKFIVNGRVIYRARNSDAIKLFSRSVHRDKIQVYHNYPGSKTWDFVVDRTPSDWCECGRSYNDTFNGVEFKWIRKPDNMKYYKNIFKYFQAPTLCQHCYYLEEFKNNRWCPKYWRQQFELIK